MASSKRKVAKVFWTGRSQAVRLPKEFRFDTESVSVRREGNAVVLEALDAWPAGYVESFAQADSDLVRREPARRDRRQKLG